MNNNPEISIIIATYNRAHFIGQAIKSILQQTYKKWELIIIDDFSTDSTESLVKKYIGSDKEGRIRYLKNEMNLGISKTRNCGLREARGTYVAMLDSDDVWLDPEKLAKQIAAFENSSGSEKPLGIVGTWISLINETEKTSGNQEKNVTRNVAFATEDADIRRAFLYKNNIAQSSVLFLKKAAVDAGGYNEKLATAEDHDLWLNIGTKYSIKNLPIYAVGYRIHTGSISRNGRKQVALDEMAVIKHWKNFYPRFWLGMIRVYLLLGRAYIA